MLSVSVPQLIWTFRANGLDRHIKNKLGRIGIYPCSRHLISLMKPFHFCGFQFYQTTWLPSLCIPYWVGIVSLSYLISLFILTKYTIKIRKCTLISLWLWDFPGWMVFSSVISINFTHLCWCKCLNFRVFRHLEGILRVVKSNLGISTTRVSEFFQASSQVGNLLLVHNRLCVGNITQGIVQ